MVLNAGSTKKFSIPRTFAVLRVASYSRNSGFKSHSEEDSGAAGLL